VERPHGDGALAGSPRPARGPRAGGAGVPTPGPRQDRPLAEQAIVEARIAGTPSRAASARAEARVRGPDRRVAASRAARHDRGRARARTAAATRLLRSERGPGSPGRPLLPAPQPHGHPVGVAVLLGVAPQVRGDRARCRARRRREHPARRGGAVNAPPPRTAGTSSSGTTRTASLTR